MAKKLINNGELIGQTEKKRSLELTLEPMRGYG